MTNTNCTVIRYHRKNETPEMNKDQVYRWTIYGVYRVREDAELKRKQLELEYPDLSWSSSDFELH